jgi:hypothetical protein
VISRSPGRLPAWVLGRPRRARGAPLSARCTRSRRSPRAVLGLVLITGAALALAPASASATLRADPLADADATVTALRRQADQAAAAYFDALGQEQALEARIAAIEARLPALKQRRRVLRANAIQRAVAAYRQAGSQVASIIDAGDALAAARQSKFLDRLNHRDNLAFDKLARVSQQLEAEHKQLEGDRAAHQVALAQLNARGRDIEAKLQAAEDRARSLKAAAAAAAKPAPPPRPVAPKGSGGAPPAAPADYHGTPGVHPKHNDPFLVCTRAHEGSYTSYNPAGPYMGAYQFLQSTWNSVANHAGRPELIGVPPNRATQYDQDDMGWTLFQWQGSRPWGGRCSQYT